MRILNWDRIGPLSGIIFAVLFPVSVSLGGGENPDPAEPAADIARKLADNRSEVEIGVYAGLLGTFFLFWFLAYLYRHLRQAEGEGGWLAWATYGGGLVAGAMLLGYISIHLAGTVLSDYGSDAQVAKTLAVLQYNYIIVLAPPLAALVGGTTVIAFRFGALPQWLGWVGVPLTVLLLVPMVALGVYLSPLWVLVVSITLFISADARGR
jgi:hypothetical protein